MLWIAGLYCGWTLDSILQLDYASYQSPFRGSLSFWLARNLDRSSCEPGSKLLLRAFWRGYLGSLPKGCHKVWFLESESLNGQ